MTREVWFAFKVTTALILLLTAVALVMALLGLLFNWMQVSQLFVVAGVRVHFLQGEDGVSFFLRVVVLGVMGFFFVLGVAALTMVILKATCGVCQDVSFRRLLRSHDYESFDASPSHASSSYSADAAACAPCNYPYYRSNPSMVWWWGWYIYIPPSPSPSSSASCCYCCFPGCCHGSQLDCSGCDCGVHVDQDAAKVIAIIALVVIALLVLAGFFFGIFLTAALAAFIIRRHASVMKRHQDTAVAVVLDLNSLPEEEKQRILRGEDVEDPCALSWERRRAVDGVSAATFSGPSKPSLEKLPLLSVNNSSPPNPNNNSLH